MNKYNIVNIKNELQNNSNSRYNLLQKYFLIQNYDINIIKKDDYAILVINNALPEEIYNLVSNDICSLKDVFLNDKNNKNAKSEKNKINTVYDSYNIMLSNHLYKLNLKDSKNDLKFKKSIDDILEYHFSKMSFNNVLKIYQDLFSDIPNISNFINSSNMLMNINYFSPVCYLPSQIKTKEISNRTLIDIRKHNILGWLFMRKDDDNSSGGNLEIYNNDKRIISIPYQKNCLVMFFNNINNIKNMKNKFEYSFTSRMTTINSMRFLDIQI